VVVIRSASAADAVQVAAVQRESWFAAYGNLIAHEIIDRVTAPDDGARVRQTFRTRPWQQMIVAETAKAETPQRAGSAASPDARVVGYASFGPETEVLGTFWPHPLSAAGKRGQVAELYALYVHPEWWSTGTGRALMDRVLSSAVGAGYPSITLWVLEGNARARRFYQRAGFSPDGARNVLDGLGGVTEVRYRRPLRSLRADAGQGGPGVRDQRPGRRAGQDGRHLLRGLAGAGLPAVAFGARGRRGLRRAARAGHRR
jgi:GNAT superfamily N-acetyltransferase